MHRDMTRVAESDGKYPTATFQNFPLQSFQNFFDINGMKFDS